MYNNLLSQNCLDNYMAAGIESFGVSSGGFKSLNQAVVSGDNTLYTCPAGKKAIFLPQTYYINASSSTSVYFKWTDGTNTYRISGAFTTTNGGSLFMARVPLVLEAGESLLLNSSGAANIFMAVCEISANEKVKTVKNFNLSNGNTTFYTCPTGKKAQILPQFLLRLANALSLLTLNPSASPATVYPYFLPKDATLSASYRVYNSAPVATSYGGFSGLTIPSVLHEGDSIVINSNLAGVNAYLTLVEA